LCSRGCILCVEISVTILLADSTEEILLVLEPIGSHSVERHFGTTRSTLSDDVRWVSFFKAQVSAMLLQMAMTDLGLRPDIRRLKSGAICTLFGSDDQGCVEADLTNMIAKVKRMGIYCHDEKNSSSSRRMSLRSLPCFIIWRTALLRSSGTKNEKIQSSFRVCYPASSLHLLRGKTGSIRDQTALFAQLTDG
jgi:hypothetical protein